MEKQFYNKNGDLTAYAFACGYMQKTDRPGLHKQIFMEHSHYHVQSTVNNSPQLHSHYSGPVSHKYTIWETFSSNELSKARKLFNSIK